MRFLKGPCALEVFEGLCVGFKLSLLAKVTGENISNNDIRPSDLLVN